MLASPTALKDYLFTDPEQNISLAIMARLIFPVVSLLLRPVRVTCVSRTRTKAGLMVLSGRARSSCHWMWIK